MTTIYISSLGIRNYEYVLGIDKASEGTLMQLKTTNPNGIVYPPAKEYITEKYMPDLRIRDELNHYKFFKDLSFEERKSWLYQHAVDKDVFINQMPNVWVKFLNINLNEVKSKNRIPLYTPEQIQLLMSPNPDEPEGYWQMETVYAMLRKPGKTQTGSRASMVFRGGNWGLVSGISTTLSTFSGIVISIDGNIANTTVQEKDYNIYPITLSDHMGSLFGNKKGKIAAVVPKSPAIQPTYEMMSSMAQTLLSQQQFNDFINFKRLIDWFSPSIYKSLMQKIIRIRPTHVEYAGTLYDSKAALLCTFCTLFIHPGALVHDIHRFVSGSESALKRAAVSILEDGYIPSSKALVSLLCAAWIAQYTKESDLPFSPSLQYINFWMNVVISSLDDPRMYKYDWHAATKVIREINDWSMLYCLIDTIKSFSTDVDMVSSIYDNNGIPSDIKDERPEQRVMPLTHCIDQHSLSDIAWFVNPIYCSQGYGTLFNNIWDMNVGINPRKMKYKQSPVLYMMENKSLSSNDQNIVAFVKDVMNAQRLLWTNKIWKPTNRELSNNDINIRYSLDISWMAALVGPTEIGVGNSIVAIAVIKSNNIYEFTAIKRPIREKDDNPHLTEEQKDYAVGNFKQMLGNGLPIKHAPNTLPDLKGSIVYYREVGNPPEPQYYIAVVDSTMQSGYKVVSWAEYINQPIVFKEQSNIINSNLENACLYTGEGIEMKHEDRFNEILTNTPLRVIKRSLIYFDGYKSNIDLYDMDRHGNSREYTVSVDDTAVNILLASICCIYPAALVKSKTGYDVKHGRLMWYVISKIKSYYLNMQSFTESKWQEPAPEPRSLWEHQKEAVSQLDDSVNSGRHGDILWFQAGTGKTLIIIGTIANRIKSGKMPKYCVYTLPDSAFDTVKMQFAMRNIPYNFISGNKTDRGNKRIIPGIINFIEHDHIRKLIEGDSGSDLKDVIGQSLFIIDEVHKAINYSQRTSSILELTCLSQQFIALTGTLIKDSNVKNLIRWLEFVVPFSVTEKNYWVALSGLISRRIETKVVVERNIIEETMNEEEKKAYYAIVPAKLGGEAQKINFPEALRLSYVAMTRRMINEIMYYLGNKLGVFVIAKDKTHAEEIKDKLGNLGVSRVMVIGRGNSVSLTPYNSSDPFAEGSSTPMVVITPAHYAEGYSLSIYKICVQAITFSNEATREQLQHRINRLDQLSPVIRIVIIHSGIFSYIMLKYESDRNLSMSIKGFAKEMEISISPEDIL